MKIFLTIFLGFTVGVIAGYSLISPAAPTQSNTGNNEIAILDPVHEKSGFVEAVNYDEQYILFSVQEAHEKKSRKILKIYFDGTEIIQKKTIYVSNASRYFHKTETLSENIAVEVGDRLRIRFVNSNTEQQFKADTIGTFYFINT